MYENKLRLLEIAQVPKDHVCIAQILVSLSEKQAESSLSEGFF